MPGQASAVLNVATTLPLLAGFFLGGVLSQALEGQGAAHPISPEETASTVHWGEAEFVAQEEMARMAGHWWSPDARHIAAERFDEGAVDVVTRAAIGASGTTTFPAVTGSSMQGTCGNCHQVHGWPVASGSGAVYSNLLVDQDPTLCFTCHDSDGPAVKNVQTDFVKLRHHPVTDAEQIPGRETRCGSCHNTHQALLGSRDYNGTATSARNAVASSPALQGASGVAVDYSTLGNFAAPSP